MNLSRLLSPAWAMNITRRYAPFADAASADLPLGRLLRLSMFQLSIGITIALLVGTLNRVMILELPVPAWWVALSVALPLVFAPLRALIGYRSDTHPSALGLKRMPYMWIGTLLMFGGLAIMPFALLLLTVEDASVWAGRIGAALAFLLVGAGMQITQTAGMALASDLSPEDKRPRVVALLYSTLLVGMILGSALLGFVLIDFTPTRLVQVVQGAAVLVAALNITSLWKQEPRQARRGAREAHGFSRSWARLMAIPKIKRFLWTVGLGTVAFNMQDIILEPYGGQVLGLNVSLTSSLTAMDLPERELTGLVLGAWGAVQATAAGLSMALGGVLRDGVSSLATHGWLGESLNSSVTGYSFVFHLEIYLLFAVLIALGPLVRRAKAAAERDPHPIGLAELPG